MSFSGGEGLPGAVMARGVPVLLDELDDESFPRAETAGEAGVVAALGLPVFDEDRLVSVVLFLFRGGPEHTGAVELWAGQRGRFELGLSRGALQRARPLRPAEPARELPDGGRACPGFVWENKCPKAVNNLSGSAGFLRSSGAETAGLAAGFGFPVCFQNELRAVMLWLSSSATPLARFHEVWISEDGGPLRFGGGAALGRPGLLDPDTAADGIPAVAEAAATKRPVLIADPDALGRPPRRRRPRRRHHRRHRPARPRPRPPPRGARCWRGEATEQPGRATDETDGNGWSEHGAGEPARASS